MRLTRGRVLAVIVLAGVAIAVLRPRAETVIADVTQQFDVARKQPAPESFELANVEIDGAPVRAIVARGETRFTIHVTVPERGGAFRVTFGLAPEVWLAPGDGVHFSIGIADGVSFRARHTRLVEPFSRPADRRWHDAVVDLREYAGLTVDVILNTRAGLPPSVDTRNDVAVWARPVLVSR